MVDEKGVPKRNGSGRGVRANRGRGNCLNTQEIGKGRGYGRGRGNGRGYGRRGRFRD